MSYIMHMHTMSFKNAVQPFLGV